MYDKLVIENKIKSFLIEDCNFKDVSSFTIPEDAIVVAQIKVKSSGYIAGLLELKILYDLLGVNTEDTEIKKKDGEKVSEGDTIMILKGKANDILFGERVGLNLISHMSAITTTTKKYVNLVKEKGKKTKIACTRKTLPGLRIFEKRAVELGGGDPHRFSLDDMILLKDTHLKYYKGNVKLLLEETKKKASFTKKIEIEVEKIEDVIIAAENGADIIILDNMTLHDVKKAMDLLKKNGLRERVLVEVSGGIDELNIANYIDMEPDIISMGHITLFPSEWVDLSLRFE